jgi:hypothetical protein
MYLIISTHIIISLLRVLTYTIIFSTYMIYIILHMPHSLYDVVLH